MEFLERQLAEAEQNMKENANASKTINDMVEAGYLIQNVDGSVSVQNPEQQQKPFDPMNIGNSN